MIETTLLDYLSPLMPGVNLAFDEAANSVTPFIEFSVLNNPEIRTTNVTSTHHTTEFEVQCWQKTAVSADALAKQLKIILRDYRGTMGAFYVFSVRFYNEFSGYSKDKLYYRNLTINISYKQG